MLGNGHAGPPPVGRFTQDDYKPISCACGGRIFTAREFYSLYRWRIGSPPAGAPEVVRVRGLEMVCEGCGAVAPAPASDPRPA